MFDREIAYVLGVVIGKASVQGDRQDADTCGVLSRKRRLRTQI